MLKLEFLGLDKLLNKTSGDTVKQPLDDGIKKITYSLEAEVKKATPVGPSGYLRSGVFTKFGETTSIYTNVSYAPFVEYGTAKMEARHVESGRRVYGQGMFAYGLSQVMKKMGDFIRNIGLKIEQKWGE